MTAWAERLARLGDVRRFDYPYALAGRRRPDPAPVLEEAHRTALRLARGRSRARIVLIGKSMGSRIGCHVALTDPVDALVCLGYPLVSAGKRRAVRDAVLLDLRSPILFVQGTRDPLCPLERLDGVRSRMIAPNRLHVVDGGDHSLHVDARTRARDRVSQENVDARSLEAIRAFLSDVWTGQL
jgi:predicted alpha/beta-hydrolase family hydrolase